MNSHSSFFRKRFWRAPCQTPSHRAAGGGLSEFLSADNLRAKANSPKFLQNSPSLLQNSVTSLFRNSTLETVFRPFPILFPGKTRTNRSSLRPPPASLANLELSRIFNPWYFLNQHCRYKREAYCSTNGRRTVVQMGGAPQGLPFFQGLEARKRATHRAGESEPQPTSGSTSGTTSGPTSGTTSAPSRGRTRG